MRNTMTSCIHLYKELEEDQVGGEFIEEKNFRIDKRKNWREKC